MKSLTRNITKNKNTSYLLHLQPLLENTDAERKTLTGSPIGHHYHQHYRHSMGMMSHFPSNGTLMLVNDCIPPNSNNNSNIHGRSSTLFPETNFSQSNSQSNDDGLLESHIPPAGDMVIHCPFHQDDHGHEDHHRHSHGRNNHLEPYVAVATATFPFDQSFRQTATDIAAEDGQEGLLLSQFAPPNAEETDRPMQLQQLQLQQQLQEEPIPLLDCQLIFYSD
jgi:hypothetical protein